jgi:PAP2 superfamily
VPAAWFDLALELIRTTPGFSPPVASRALGYAGVALYEAVVPGIPRRHSLVGRLDGLTRVPRPAAGEHHWPTVANSALAAGVRLLFPTTPSGNVAAIDALDRSFGEPARATLPRAIYDRSVARGADVARHVFAWSTTDGGHEGFLRNFPPYTPPSGPGRWVPTPPAFQSALQPFWGANRSLLRSARRIDAPGPPPPYSETSASAFHAEALECYRVTGELTAEQQAIARFWSDDPGQTPTPPGHSVSILTQVVRALDLSLDRAAEAYAKVGIALADAFISCWRTKYRYNLLRPVTYIRSLIDPSWTPLLVTPPFPEYTSGHSVQSGAAAAVLTDLFGDLAFTDHTHDGRGLPPRSFNSFQEAAQEAAISRIYGGIHFRSAVELGLQQGARIGTRVNALA